MTSDWLLTLRRLRPALLSRREGGQLVGSLRWLEAELGRRGGNPAALRNIVYRDIGTPEDKRRLGEILRDLSLEAGLEAATWPGEAPAPPPSAEAEHLSLGKRRLYRRFLSEVRRGKAARMLVVAPPGAGKTILVDALAHALPGSLRLRLEGDFAPELERLAGQLGLDMALVARTLGALDERAAFAVAGGLQAELCRALVAKLSAQTLPLLLRVGEQGTLGGHPLRLSSGESCGAPLWVWHHLLLPLSGDGPPLFAALAHAEGLPDALGAFREVLPLPSPSLEDARKFVRAKLPELPPPQVERIVRQAGRDYDALGLLTLLSAVDEDLQPDAPLPPLRDGALRDFLLVVEVCFSREFPEADLSFFTALLGESLEQRRALERAFLEVAGEHVRPTRPELAGKLLSRVNLRAAALPLHRQALGLALAAGDLPRALHHALRGELWDTVNQLSVSGTALENAWRKARSAEYPPAVTEHLARLLASEFALRGQYGHPEMLAALETLSGSDDPNLRVWAAVKRAEALIDHACYAEAREQLAAPPGDDPLTQAEHTLSRAAVTRWEGRPDLAAALLDEAEAYAQRVPSEYQATLQVKIRLWRSLGTKDLGDWKVALPLLREVMNEPGASPLQRARAAYQLGDALMRLGQQGEACEALNTALHGLELHGATPEERSRAAARLASVLRRLGRLTEAGAMMKRAIALAPDPFTLARAWSEAVPLYAAQGHLAPALLAGRRAWLSFSGAEELRPSEAKYRRLRAEYRVALAYIVRGLQQPYLPPMSGATHEHPDLVHARRLLAGVQGAIPDSLADRLASLRVDTSLALALATPDAADAQAHARMAVQAAAHPYQTAQARTGLAEALLRGGQTESALLEIGRAYRAARQAAQLTGHSDWDEPGLQAWLALLDFGAALPEDPPGAWEGLRLALRDPHLAPFGGSLAVQAAALLRGAGRGEWAAELSADPLLAPWDAARLNFGSGEEGNEVP